MSEVFGDMVCTGCDANLFFAKELPLFLVSGKMCVKCPACKEILEVKKITENYEICIQERE